MEAVRMKRPLAAVPFAIPFMALLISCNRQPENR